MRQRACWVVMACAATTAALALAMQLQFVPPDEQQRAAALGGMKGVPAALQRAFDPRSGFVPIRKPGPRDWLAQHPEPGQTFEDFIRSRPNRPGGRWNKLYLQPLGPIESAGGPPVEKLARYASAFFGMETAVLPALAIEKVQVTRRRNSSTGKEQLLAPEILGLLRARLPKDAYALLGVTMSDLYPDPRWNFVFGQASLRERVGVYSFARYDPRFYGETVPNPRQVILRRSCKVLAHETGHMFGIQHCIWYQCLMNGSNHMEESDASPLHLCPVDLRKLEWSVGFDVAQRYQRLLAFDTEAGFEDESAWLRGRLDLLSRRAGER